MRASSPWYAVSLAVVVVVAASGAAVAAPEVDAGAADAAGEAGSFDASVAPAARSPAPLGPIVPAYPEAASRAGIAGNVTLLLTIDAQGAVTGVEVEAGLPGGLTEAAVASARVARFSPATDAGGRPVAARVR